MENEKLHEKLVFMEKKWFFQQEIFCGLKDNTDSHECLRDFEMYIIFFLIHCNESLLVFCIVSLLFQVIQFQISSASQQLIADSKFWKLFNRMKV